MCRALIYERGARAVEAPTPVKSRPAQDLRSVLKVAKPGRPTKKPDESNPKITGTSVVELRPGVIACWGLYDLRAKIPP